MNKIIVKYSVLLNFFFTHYICNISTLHYIYSRITFIRVHFTVNIHQTFIQGHASVLRETESVPCNSTEYVHAEGHSTCKLLKK